MKATTFLQIAYLVSQESKCCSWKVGAVIEKNGRIISTGVNGTPAGGVNCCDHAQDKGWLINPAKTYPGEGYRNRVMLDYKFRADHSSWSAKNEIHAELNAILFAARNGTSIEGATMYVTLSPCQDCAKAIAQSGIRKLVYCESYDKIVPGWEDVLTDAGVEVMCLSPRNLNLLDWNNIQSFCGFEL